MNLEETDSYVKIRIQGEEFEEDNSSDRHTDTVVRDVTFERHRSLDRSIVNLDHFFQPPEDFFYDQANPVEVNDSEVLLDFMEHEFEFTLYRDELQEAITQRAAEDGCSPEVTAERWATRAKLADHVSDGVVEAIREAAE